MSNKLAANSLKLLKLSAILAFAAGVSGCATTVLAVGASAAAVAISDKTAGVAIDDAAATAELKAKMINGKGYNLSDVHIAMSEGFVLLAGSAPTPQDRIEAERRAWTVSAVRNVANELKVGPSRTIAQSLKDKVIGTQVRSKFISSTVKGMNYTIETHEGDVYLLGIARTSAELTDAVEEARTVNGVQKVVSYVRVDKRPTIEQPETPAQAAARRAEEQGLAAQPRPRQTGPYGPQGAPAAQPDYAQYEPATPAAYNQPAYSQQPSYAASRAPAPGAPYAYGGPPAPDPITGSPISAETLGPASDSFAGEVRPPVPDVAPYTGPSSYTAPAYQGPVSAPGSGPVVLTPP